MPYLNRDKFGQKMATYQLLVVVLTLIYHTSANSLVLFQTQIGNGNQYNVQISNGQFVVDALVSDEDGLLSCRVLENREKAVVLYTHESGTKLDVGPKGTMDILKRCITKELIQNNAKRDGASGDGIPFTPEKTGDPAGHKFDPAIFPGTKWCGLNNVASSYDDLGKFKATDACCRDHDHCPYFLDHFQEKYHMRNPYPWTISHCDCDTKLFNCLKKINTTTSNEVGETFFGLLSVKCIQFETGQYCVKEHWTQLWCEQTATGEKAVLHPFPYKWSDDVVG